MHFRAMKLIHWGSDSAEMLILKEGFIMKTVYLKKDHMNNELSKAKREKERTEIILVFIFLNPAKWSRNDKDQKLV